MSFSATTLSGSKPEQYAQLLGQARALLHGRLAATREDVAALLAPVLRHRLVLSFAAEAAQTDADAMIAGLLRALPAPER